MLSLITNTIQFISIIHSVITFYLKIIIEENYLFLLSEYQKYIFIIYFSFG